MSMTFSSDSEDGSNTEGNDDESTGSANTEYMDDNDSYTS
jgi:hypothetical protein